MKLKNNVVLILANNGGLNLTANTLNANEAYNVIKFRRGIAKVLNMLQESEKEILKECNLEISNKGSLNGSEEDKIKFIKLRTELYNDESEIGEINSLQYPSWHLLKNENKILGDAFIEDNLEGIL